MTGDLLLLDFEITDPFIWDIPKEEPVLSFEVEQASLSQEGLYMDGMQTFLPGDQELEVIFDNVLFDILQMQLLDGEIVFENDFALEAGVDPTDMSLTYQAVPFDADPTLDPGLLFGLAGNVRIDDQGLRASGEAHAKLTFPSVDLPLLDIHFSDDFAFGLDPFAVTSGEAEIVLENNTVAVIDQHGFYLLYGVEDIADLLPAHIPLPSHHIAYLVIKDEEGNLLLDIEGSLDDLSFTMNTGPESLSPMFFPSSKHTWGKHPR